MATLTAPTAAVPSRPAGSPEPGEPLSVRAALVEWLVKRGILFVLLLSPVTALFVGLTRMVPTRIGYLVLLLAFMALPVWVVWRRSVSTDPTEPVFHLHRHALYALFPYVVFSVVRIPMFYLFDVVYWSPWHRFGYQSTGESVGQFSSLVLGSVLYSLQGYSLAMGFYTLFKRHTMTNALLYFFVFISSLYAYVFPVFLMSGSKPGLTFQFVNYWAHFWMGVTAALMPVLFQRYWPRLRRGVRTALVGGLAVVWLTPYVFAYGHAVWWQFDKQVGLERAAFAATSLQLGGTPAMTVAENQTRYQLTMQYGPREYTTYSHVHKAVNAEGIAVSGRLMIQGTTVAWCTGAVDSLTTMRTVLDPMKYFSVLETINHSPIPVSCSGPAAAPNVVPGTPVTFEYTATMTQFGERSSAPREFTGTAQTVLSAG